MQDLFALYYARNAGNVSLRLSVKGSGGGASILPFPQASNGAGVC